MEETEKKSKQYCIAILELNKNSLVISTNNEENVPFFCFHLLRKFLVTLYLPAKMVNKNKKMNTYSTLLLSE